MPQPGAVGRGLARENAVLQHLAKSQSTGCLDRSKSSAFHQRSALQESSRLGSPARSVGTSVQVDPGSGPPVAGKRSSKLQELRLRKQRSASEADLRNAEATGHAGAAPQATPSKRIYDAARTVNGIDRHVFNAPEPLSARTLQDLGELGNDYATGIGLGSWQQRVVHKSDTQPHLAAPENASRYQSKQMVPHNPHRSSGDAAELIHQSSYHLHDDLDNIHREAAGSRTWRRRLLGHPQPPDAVAVGRRKLQVSPQQISQVNDLIWKRDLDRSARQYIPQYRREMEKYAGLPHWSKRDYAVFHTSGDRGGEDKLWTASKKMMPDIIPSMTQADEVIQGRDLDQPAERVRSPDRNYQQQFDGAAGTRTGLWRLGGANKVRDARQTDLARPESLRTYHGIHDNDPSVATIVFNHRLDSSGARKDSALLEELAQQRAGATSTRVNELNKEPEGFSGYVFVPTRRLRKVGVQRPCLVAEDVFHRPQLSAREQALAPEADCAGIINGPNPGVSQRARNPCSEAGRRGQAGDLIHSGNESEAERERDKFHNWLVDAGEGAAGVANWTAAARDAWDVAATPHKRPGSTPLVRSRRFYYGHPGIGHGFRHAVLGEDGDERRAMQREREASPLQCPGVSREVLDPRPSAGYRRQFDSHRAGQRSWSADPPQGKRNGLASLADVHEAMYYRPPSRGKLSRSSSIDLGPGSRSPSVDPDMASARRPHEYERDGMPEPCLGDPARIPVPAGIISGNNIHGTPNLLHHQCRGAYSARSCISSRRSSQASTASTDDRPRLRPTRYNDKVPVPASARTHRSRRDLGRTSPTPSSRASSVSSLRAAGLPSGRPVRPVEVQPAAVAKVVDLDTLPLVSERSGITRSRRMRRECSWSPMAVSLQGIL
mmetsp:Transcript_26924/g.58581  ORF Transcript_26924/g.58581 Transcript_26924/m.58581 type:complete len:889 (+) Transcript_26924:27-2693(+)